MKEGLNQTEIANNIGVNRSTISRELKRNVTNDGPPGNSYRAGTAQELTDQCHAGKAKHRRFTEDLKAQAPAGG